MPRVDAVVSCRVPDSFRVQQVAGMFDMPLAARAEEEFSVDVPGLDEPWDVGLIVGPSGSGKSTIAKRAFGDALYRAGAWPANQAVIDALSDVSTREAIGLLTAVGLSSPPAWIKPYAVLSCGERFRCDLARSLAMRPPGFPAPQIADRRPLAVYDEFTSVVDRNVARACAFAVAKAIRSGRVQRRFVAVTCHADVEPWLEPDWALDMATGFLTRRRLRRPRICVEVRRCGLGAWSLFARHHYLSGALASSARCYLATWEERPVTFCGTLPMMARRRHRRFTRIVTLPDYQGMEIGMRVVEAVATGYRQRGERINVTSSHPALVAHCKRSPEWRTVSVKRNGSHVRATSFGPHRSSAGRAVASFEFIGTPLAYVN